MKYIKNMANIRKLSSGLAKIAKDEFLEIESEIPVKINALRKLLQEEPNLKTPLDDQFLVTFLRCNKHNVSDAHEMIKQFFIWRLKVPYLITKRDPLDSRNMQLMKLGCTLVLPKTLGELGPRMVIMRPGAYDPKQFVYKEIMKLTTAIIDIVTMEDDNCTISGVIGIMDMCNMSKEHIFQMDMDMMKNMSASQRYQPVTPKGIHFVNAPWAFRSILSILKTFMNEEMKRAINVHASFESLHEHVPVEYLPEEYGGKVGTIEEIRNDWENKLIEKREFLLEWDKYGDNEALAAEVAQNSRRKFWW